MCHGVNVQVFTDPSGQPDARLHPRHVRVPLRGRRPKRRKRRHNSSHAKICCLVEQAVAVLRGRRLRKLRCWTNRITAS